MAQKLRRQDGKKLVAEKIFFRHYHRPPQSFGVILNQTKHILQYGTFPYCSENLWKVRYIGNILEFRSNFSLFSAISDGAIWDFRSNFLCFPNISAVFPTFYCTKLRKCKSGATIFEINTLPWWPILVVVEEIN